MLIALGATVGLYVLVGLAAGLAETVGDVPDGSAPMDVFETVLIWPVLLVIKLNDRRKASHD